MSNFNVSAFFTKVRFLSRSYTITSRSVGQNCSFSERSLQVSPEGVQSTSRSKNGSTDPGLPSASFINAGKDSSDAISSHPVDTSRLLPLTNSNCESYLKQSPFKEKNIKIFKSFILNRLRNCVGGVRELSMCTLYSCTNRKHSVLLVLCSFIGENINKNFQNM